MSQTPHRLNLRLGALVFLIIGCERAERVDYSEWKNVVPDAVIALPEFDKSVTSKPISIDKQIIPANSNISFSGRLKQASSETKKGSTLSIVIVKMSRKKPITYASTATVISFATEQEASFQVF